MAGASWGFEMLCSSRPVSRNHLRDGRDSRSTSRSRADSFKTEFPPLRISKLGFDGQHCVAMSRRSHAPRNAQRFSSGTPRSLEVYKALSLVVSRPYKVPQGSRIPSVICVDAVMSLSLSAELSRDTLEFVMASSWSSSWYMWGSKST